MTCALCHSYTTCKYSSGRFLIFGIETSDAFLACPQSYGGLKDLRGTFAGLYLEMYKKGGGV